MIPSSPSIWSFIIHAGPVVKCVMLILFFASITSWTLIFQRHRLLRLRRKEAKQFEKRFWSGIDLNQLNQSLEHERSPLTGLAHIFHAGFSDYLKAIKKPNTSLKAVLTSCQRSMRIAESQELDHLEKNLSFLATVGSNSVYIGLFGTVWGIISAFRGLSLVEQATIAMVAPGISEALIATAIGLIAAIPAVIAYNFFSSQIERLENSYQIFQQEFLSILEHQGDPEQRCLAPEKNQHNLDNLGEPYAPSA